MAQVDAETTKGGEMQCQNNWNFDEWLKQHELEGMKQVFIDHNMTTLDSLTMNNKQFGAVTSDQRIITKPLLFPKIIAGMQSLESIRNKQKEKEKTKLIFVTKKENEVLTQIKQYMINMKKINDEFKEIDTKYNNKQLIKEQFITNHIDNKIIKLNEREDEITKLFHQLTRILNEKEIMLKNKINEYREELNKLRAKNEQIMRNMDDKLNEIHSKIVGDEQYFKENSVRCKDIMRDYNDNDDDGDDDDIYNLNEKNEEREHKIIEIGNDTKNYYKDTVECINSNKKQILQYMKNNNIEFENDIDDEKSRDKYSIDDNKNIYQNIIIDMMAQSPSTITIPDQNRDRKYKDLKIKYNELFKSQKSLMNQHSELKKQNEIQQQLTDELLSNESKNIATIKQQQSEINNLSNKREEEKLMQPSQDDIHSNELIMLIHSNDVIDENDNNADNDAHIEAYIVEQDENKEKWQSKRRKTKRNGQKMKKKKNSKVQHEIASLKHQLKEKNKTIRELQQSNFHKGTELQRQQTAIMMRNAEITSMHIELQKKCAIKKGVDALQTLVTTKNNQIDELNQQITKLNVLQKKQEDMVIHCKKQMEQYQLMLHKYKENEQKEQLETLDTDDYHEDKNITFIHYFDKGWINGDKWLLSMNQYGRRNGTMKAISDDRNDYKYYCAFLSFNADKADIHYCSIQWTKGTNTFYRRAPCCIGIVSKKNKSWIHDGVESLHKWTIGAYSYFDGWNHAPYWYVGETITVRIDFITHYISYGKEGKIFKEAKLPQTGPYYLMLCSSVHPKHACQYSTVRSQLF